jgi:hypothetical protein
MKEKNKIAKTKTIFQVSKGNRSAVIGQYESGRIALLFTGDSDHDGKYYDINKREIPKAKNVARQFVNTDNIKW